MCILRHKNVQKGLERYSKFLTMIINSHKSGTREVYMRENLHFVHILYLNLLCEVHRHTHTYTHTL